MNRQELQLLQEGLRQLGITPQSGIVSSFSVFLEELILWNRSTNLIGQADPSQIIIKHILDSAAVYPLIKNKSRSIVDLGAGAGFPSVPLAIVDPGLDILAVERRNKRAAFLRNIGVMMGLANFRVHQGDAREVAGSYDVVTARGVGELSLIYSLSRRLLKNKAMILAFKGKITEIEKEIKRLKQQQSTQGKLSLRIQKVNVPFLEDEERNIVIIQTLA
ncbi:MAG: 16S rRNA (guanine(527)-N(7))-methyltransferase RsmG [Spirochaetota bacterium]